MSIATEIQRLQGAKADIKTAIEAKGVTVESSLKLDGYAAKIAEIPTGGGEEDDNYSNDDVRLIDYDGVQLFGYTKAEFLALTALPTPTRSHDNLTFRSWNWSLSDAKTYVTAYKTLIIGAEYNTKNGATFITMNIDDDRIMTLPLYFGQSAASAVEVDWGDGSTPETFSQTQVMAHSHTYTQKGIYTIKMTPASGKSFSFSTSGGDGFFGYCSNTYNLLYSQAVVSVLFGSFAANQKLGFTQNISTLLVQKILQSFDSMSSCKLKCAVFPDGYTSIGNGSLLSTINAKDLSLPKGVTSIGTQSFAAMNHLRRIIIPDSVTTLGNNCFQHCIGADKIVIPDSVTSVGQRAFQNCHGAKYIYIGSAVTSIGAEAFRCQYGTGQIKIEEIHIAATTPPTLGANGFTQGTGSVQWKMYVPQGKLAIYQAETNWSAFASYMYEEPTT